MSNIRTILAVEEREATVLARSRVCEEMEWQARRQSGERTLPDTLRAAVLRIAKISSKSRDIIFGWTISDRYQMGVDEEVTVECRKSCFAGNLKYRWLEHNEGGGGVNIEEKDWQSFVDMENCLSKKTAQTIRQELAKQRPEILPVWLLKNDMAGPLQS